MTAERRGWILIAVGLAIVVLALSPMWVGLAIGFLSLLVGIATLWRQAQRAKVKEQKSA